MTVNCPHCRATTFRSVYQYTIDSIAYQLVECGSCVHFYTWQNEEADPDTLYNSGAYVIHDTKRTFFTTIKEMEYSLILTQIQKFAIPSSGTSLLDFGCGKGDFLKSVKNEGYEVYGVETAQNRAEFARQVQGLEVKSEFYDGKSVIFGSPMNVITLFHVQEHLPNPTSIIKGLLHLNLKKDGLMVIEVPYWGSWQSIIAGKNWLHLDITRHINHYTKQYLDTFIQGQLGGVIVRKSTLSIHLGIIGMLQALFNLFGYRKSLIEDLKGEKSIGLLASLAIGIIPALLLESMAVLLGKGGVYRVYVRKR